MSFDPASLFLSVPLPPTGGMSSEAQVQPSTQAGALTNDAGAQIQALFSSLLSAMGDVKTDTQAGSQAGTQADTQADAQTVSQEVSQAGSQAGLVATANPPAAGNAQVQALLSSLAAALGETVAPATASAEAAASNAGSSEVGNEATNQVAGNAGPVASAADTATSDPLAGLEALLAAFVTRPANVSADGATLQSASVKTSAPVRVMTVTQTGSAGDAVQSQPVPDPGQPNPAIAAAQAPDAGDADTALSARPPVRQSASTQTSGTKTSGTQISGTQVKAADATMSDPALLAQAMAFMTAKPAQTAAKTVATHDGAFAAPSLQAAPSPSPSTPPQTNAAAPQQGAPQSNMADMASAAASFGDHLTGLSASAGMVSAQISAQIPAQTRSRAANADDPAAGQALGQAPGQTPASAFTLKTYDADATGTYTPSGPAGAAPVSPEAASASAAQTAAPAAGQMSQASVQTLTDLSLQIQHRLAAGQSEFRLQLTPESMGKVDVVMTIGAGGETRAHLTFDNAASAEHVTAQLDDLRDQLRQSGLSLDDGALTAAARRDDAAAPVGGHAAAAAVHTAADTAGVAASSGSDNANSSTYQQGRDTSQAYDPSGGRHNGQSDANSQSRRQDRQQAQALAAADALDPVMTADDADLALLGRSGGAARLALNLVV